MASLVFPEAATITVLTAGDEGVVPLRVANIAFGVRTAGCRKNDYRFGPFFSGTDGRVSITRRALELSARAQLETGLMDYGPVSECRPEIQIEHWTGEEVARAEEARRTVWTRPLAGELELYGSLGELLDRYRAAPNSRLGAASPIRDRWDGTRARVAYEYVVSLGAPA